jgi:acyl-CoA thioester hydrolase
MHVHSSPPGGSLDGSTHVFPLRVYYEDTDLTGVVYHANYLRWFERARSDLLRQIGIDQRAVKEAGEGFYTVAELTIRYLAPARLDDAVAVVTRPVELKSASCRLLQQAWRGDDLLAEAQVRVGFVGDGGRPKRQPAAWRTAFATLMDDTGTA